MLNISELENRWRKYKVKSLIPYISVLFICIIALFAVYSFMKINRETNNITKKSLIKKVEHEKSNTEVNEKKLKEKTDVLFKRKNKHTITNEKTTLSPSLNFMSSIKYTSPSYHKHRTRLKTRKKPKKEKEKESVVEKEKVNEKPKQIKEQIKEQEHKQDKEGKQPRENNIKIKRKNTTQDISKVLSRFQKNNNPALSLFIAKKYYELANYRQSYNYALITNQINDKIESSWIIFTKSLVKLHKKDEAIKTLKKYISHTNSNQATILLEDITSGKFK